MRKIKLSFFLVVFFSGLLAISCHKDEKYTFDFLPAPIIKYIPSNDTLIVDSLSVLGQKAIIAADSIKSVVGLASVRYYSLTTRSLSDTSTFLTTTDTTLIHEYTTFANPNLFVNVDTLVYNKNYIGYYTVATDVSGQVMKRKQVHVLSLCTYANAYQTLSLTGLSTSSTSNVSIIFAQGVIATANTSANCISVSASFVAPYATAAASDPVYTNAKSALIDFAFWLNPASGTSISTFQFASMNYLSTLGSQFFATTHAWPTLNKTLFLKVNDKFKNFGLPITASDLLNFDMTAAIDPINVQAKDLILCETATGKRALIYVQAIASASTKSKVQMTVKCTK